MKRCAGSTCRGSEDGQLGCNMIRKDDGLDNVFVQVAIVPEDYRPLLSRGSETEAGNGVLSALVLSDQVTVAANCSPQHLRSNIEHVTSQIVDLRIVPKC